MPPIHNFPTKPPTLYPEGSQHTKKIRRGGSPGDKRGGGLRHTPHGTDGGLDRF
jgi:hypothetical protein